MGIKNFIKLISDHSPNSINKTNITKYSNKVVGIDTNLFLYKLIYAIRKNGYDLKNNNKKVTHIHTLLIKLLAFRKYKIRPVFVFDGENPEIKLQELKKRSEIRNRLINKYKKSKNKDDKRKLYYIKSIITEEEIKECRQLINIFGFPIIDSIEEADSQLAYLSKNNLIDYIISDDPDILLFGGKNILKNFTISPNKYIIEINLGGILNELKITQKELIYLGISLGCDYCAISNSPKKSLELIKESKFFDKYDKAINYFINPPYIKINKLEFKKIDRHTINDNLKKYLVQFNFKNAYIKKYIN